MLWLKFSIYSDNISVVAARNQKKDIPAVSVKFQATESVEDRKRSGWHPSVTFEKDIVSVQ